MGFESNKCPRISKNIISFKTAENNSFSKLIALELSSLDQKTGFTKATLISRYRELVEFLENYPSDSDESISLLLLGTGNQGISLEESVSELLSTFSQLKNTRLKIIRIFANNFESIGVLNKKMVL